MTWSDPAGGDRRPAWDPDATEVLPLPAATGRWSAPGPDSDITSTRPLPRIDGDAYAPRANTVPPEGHTRRDAVRDARRDARRASKTAKVVWAAAALAACTTGGIAIGTMTADPARPAASELPTGPATPAPTPTPTPTSHPPTATAPEPSNGPASYQVTLETAEAEEAGTDSDVQGRLTDEAGRTSAWTVLDTDGHNDFEADTRATYVIDVPAAFGRPASLQLWKGGKDAWAVESGVRITGPDGYSALWHPAGASPHLWITGGDAAPDDGSPVFTAYSPNGTLAGERT